MNLTKANYELKKTYFAVRKDVEEEVRNCSEVVKEDLLKIEAE